MTPAYLALLDRALLGALSVPTQYTPGAGGTVTVDGIFDAAYVRVGVGEAGVSSTTPMVFYRLDDLPSNPDDDDPTITVHGDAYRVTEVQKVGTDAVRLLLHRR